jgi:HEPN domain-containing protein
MDDGLREQVQEWLAHARQDSEAAALIMRDRGPAGAAAMHIQQAIEKHLKALVVSHDEAPRRTHNLAVLLDEAAQHAPRLSEHQDLCERATRYYATHRCPAGPPPAYAWEVLEADLCEAQALASMIVVHIEAM